MFSELKMVGQWFLDEPSEAWDFDEVAFDSETQRILTDLTQPNRLLIVFEHSAKVVLQGKSQNSCYIPSQYFLYALKLRPLLALLNKYQETLTALINEVGTTSKKHTIGALRSQDKTSSALNKIDGYSQDQFFRIFGTDQSARLGGKAFITSDDEHRSPSDFFASILLAAVPVPNASSGALADLLFTLSQNKEILEHLHNLYIDKLPWLFRSHDGDELIFRVMCALGWDGKLDGILDTEPAIWGDITDAFLVRPTPEPSNSRYIEVPIHFLESCRKYVFVRKGLLDLSTIDVISKLVEEFCPSMCIRFKGGDYFFVPKTRRCVLETEVKGGSNKIFYGAPGTGKSHRLRHEVSADQDTFVTVFHADTLHADFVGALKPAMEGGQVVYRFRAGPFTNALIHALQHPDRKVSLVIEEINRASAAAVFGELFQLLDRSPDGESTYSIHAADPDMLSHINLELARSGCAPQKYLRIPANLSLLATMNSSDQAVMPLDTAFKRRWNFEYLPIDFSASNVPRIQIALATDYGLINVSWPRLAEIINETLVECDVAEDRLIGPFFLSAKELEDEEKARLAISSKLFIYLWDDVLRHHGPERVFCPTHRTFGQLSTAFADGKPVFSSSIEERLKEAGSDGPSSQI